jgi:glycosyltransferase involved in cell wall biosynthesis
MNNIVVSFIIPVFNSEIFIEKCLLSIRKQFYSNEEYEVIILDNGSVDCTHQIMKELGFNFQVIQKVNVSTLRNYGAAVAQGDYLAFVDSDVELSPYWLQNALSSFHDCHVVASGCFPGIPQSSTWVQRAWDLHQRGRKNLTKPTPIPWLPSMNLIVRRDDFAAISGFNEDLVTAEDVDLCYRLSQRGTILCNPSMQAIHWGEAKNLRTFWRKEAWRGIGNLKGLLSHGFRWDELPSLVHPLYVIVALLLLAMAVSKDFWSQQISFMPLSLAMLLCPPLFLAMNTARLANRLGTMPGLFLLYLIYGVARACAVLRGLTVLLR